MTILNILYYPDKRLRTVAQPVTTVDDSIRRLIDDMFETMYDAPGIGLAATQVDVHKRVIVIDTSEEGDDPQVLINPEIIERDGVEIYQEGCLSVPDIYENVERAEHVVVKTLTRDGEETRIDAHGLLAICIQHEMDHLQGKLFVDYLSPLKQQRVKKKLLKSQRLATSV
jgi:peptide deformylase